MKTPPNAQIISPQAGFQEKFVRSSVDVVFGGGSLNCGKAQPVYSLVSTPSGFKPISDLKIGDIINDTNSGTQIIENIYDRGERQIIRLHFDNGNHIDCCIEHLWDIIDKGVQKTVETSDIIYSIDKGRKVCIPLTKPVYFKEKGDLPIHPYILGTIIGGGHFSTETGTIQERFIREGLRELKLMGLHSHEKFIPEQYKYTSIENRIEIIRGLFDTDGHQDKRSNRIEYTTTSLQLANDVKFIFESLGGKISISSKIGNYKDKDGNKVACKKAYRLQCRISNLNDFVTLERKKVHRDKIKNIYHNIVSYERMGMVKMKCLLVSSPNHLYLTDNFIVTHNTFASILSVAEPALDPRFRAGFTRRTFGELGMSGGIVDDFSTAFGDIIDIKKTDPPRVTFPSGASVEMRQINDENIKKVTETFKGWQCDLIYMDELTSYQFSTFKYLLTRNRGKAAWTGKFRGTTNPKRSSWVREFIDWYVGVDGKIIPERDGVIRYFYLNGNTVKDVVWGDSKEEVYKKCKIDIDKKLKAVGGNFTYENSIKSFTFYLGRMSENMASIGTNMDYLGSVAAVGGAQAQQLLESNWNADEFEDGEAPIPANLAYSVLDNDPMRNGDRWISADLADKGKDNFLAVIWDGLHIEDIIVKGNTTPRENAEILKKLASRYDIPDNHIVFDGNNAAYINDYIPDAIPFISYSKPMGLYSRAVCSIKDEAYKRLVEVIKKEHLSFNKEVANRIYYHNKMKEQHPIGTEFVEECIVVRFREAPGGKNRLLKKEELNRLLGKSRSMDILDAIAMRMYPLCMYEYGTELEMTRVHHSTEKSTPLSLYEQITKGNIYDDSFWA